MTITQALPIDGELQKLWIELLPVVVAAISGMAGSPDEIDNSLLDSIAHCSDDVFYESRNMVKRLFEAVNDPEIASAAIDELGSLAIFIFGQLRQLERSEWPTLMFLSYCHSKHNSDSKLPAYSSIYIDN